MRDHARPREPAVRNVTAVIAGGLVVMLIAATAITLGVARSQLRSADHTVDRRAAELGPLLATRYDDLALVATALADLLGEDELLAVEEFASCTRSFRCCGRPAFGSSQTQTGLAPSTRLRVRASSTTTVFRQRKRPKWIQSFFGA